MFTKIYLDKGIVSDTLYSGESLSYDTFDLINCCGPSQHRIYKPQFWQRMYFHKRFLVQCCDGFCIFFVLHGCNAKWTRFLTKYWKCHLKRKITEGHKLPIPYITEQQQQQVSTVLRLNLHKRGPRRWQGWRRTLVVMDRNFTSRPPL